MHLLHDKNYICDPTIAVQSTNVYTFLIYYPLTELGKNIIQIIVKNSSE